MPVTRFQRIQTDNEELQLMQNRLAESLDSLTAIPMLDGVFRKQVPLTPGSNIISHGLGRNYVSFFSGNFSRPSRLSVGASPDASKYINIISTDPCSADLWLY